MKNFACYDVFNRGDASCTAHFHVEIERRLPHRYEEAELLLLSGVFLRDLEFDGLVGLLQPAEQRRSRFAHLEIDRSVLDLHNNIAVKLAVERMKDVIGRHCTVILRITPIEMIVVNERPIEHKPAVGLQRDRKSTRLNSSHVSI